MTSGACQLGEPQPSTNNQLKSSTCVRLLALEQQQVDSSERLESSSVDSTTQDTTLNEEELVGEVETCDDERVRPQQRTPSASSDSGQLSLLSSFGSLSLGGYQNTTNDSTNQNATSNDSASRQSVSVVDIDQHQFYCSLMLFNSLDFSQFEQATTESVDLHRLDSHTLNKQRAKSNSSLSNNNLNTLNQIQEQSDCRGQPVAVDATAKEKINSRPKQVKLGVVESVVSITAKKAEEAVSSTKKLKKRSSSILGGNRHRSEKVNTIVTVATAANNSVNFVDKLLAHIVKRSSNSVNRATPAPSSLVSGNTDKGNVKSALKQDTAMNSDSKSKSGGSLAAKDQKKEKATLSGSSSIHLLSDLSRRIVRRCGGAISGSSGGNGSVSSGIKSKQAAQSNGARNGMVQQVNSESEGSSGSSSGCEWRQTQSSTASSIASRTMSKPDQAQLGVGGRAVLDRAQLSMPSAASNASSQSNLACDKLVEVQHQHQLFARANNNNNNTIELTNSSNLYASISTLNTTPSNCCFCDNETCSSSGFISSSTNVAVGGGGCVSGSGGDGCADRIGSLSGCMSGINSNNCGDSTTTHSCNSSTYNEPISSTVPANNVSFNVSQTNHIYSPVPASSGITNPNRAIVYSCCWPSPQHEKLQDRSHQGSQTYFNHPNQCEPSSIVTENSLETSKTMTTFESIVPVANQCVQLGPNSTVTSINVELFGNQQQAQNLAQSMTEVQHTEADGQAGNEESKSSGSKKEEGGGGFLKPKSLLTRARNSTINLASLATMTNRFNYSASVGNLWHHGQHHGNQNELADDIAADGIQTLDYNATGAFDSYQPDDGQGKSPSNEPRSIKTTSSHKLLSVASLGSARKLSTKEKCKRQKDAERVEKLRLLVSYLKSGSSQPLVNPVALEADEIELAERYKLHMILRDDLLRDVQNSDQQQQQATTQNQLGDTGTIDNRAEHKQMSEVVDKGRKISRSIGGTTTSSPASSSSGSMNHAHSTNDGHSIPHIGDVTWVLRHSISDPGNNFEHSPAFSSSSSSHNHPTRDIHHHQHHNQLHQDRHHHHNYQHNHQRHHNLQNNEIVTRSHLFEQGHTAHDHSEGANCESCAPSSSYSGSSLNNYCSAPAINKDALKLQQTATSSQQKSPKLFYIEDVDHIPVVLNGPSLSPTTANNQPSSTSALYAPSSSTCSSQPATPAISTTSGSGECIRNSSCASTSAWSNAPNLASWIDNEVNSIVHDLEAKSQQLSSKGDSKQSKSGKKKWLSVTSSTSRRNSSGAQST